MDEVGRFDEGGASRHSSTDDPVAGFGATGSSLHKTASRLNEFTRPLAAEPSALEVVEALPAPQAQPLEKVVRESERVKVPPEKLRTGREGDADAPARAADAERTRRGSALASDDDESVASDVAPATRPTPVTIQRTEAATGSGALASLSPTGAAAKRAQGESKHAPVAAGAAAAMQAAPRAAPAATTAATTAAHRAHDAASTADSKPVVPAPRAEHAAPPKHTAAAATVHTPSKSESSQATPRESKDSRKSVTQAPAAPAPAPAPAPAASARALEEDSAMPEAITVDELKQRYQMLDMVGEGAYGMVMKCRSRESGVYVAIKEFKVDDTDPDAAEVRRTALREVRLLRMLQHPNVVRYIDGFMVSSRLFISMEYVPRNVLELLEAQPSGHLDRATVRSVMYQLICAIEFIHRQGIIYRDIKPENLLIDNDGRLKLCDFGFARRVRKGDVLTDYVATRWYRAPELLLGPPFRQHNGQMWRPTYDAAVDMWAIGCLMGELTDGEPLFPGDSDVDQMHRIQQMLGTAIGEHVRQFYCNPQNKGAAFKPVRNPTTLERRYRGKMGAVELDLMSKLLHMDPARRITGKEALKHPYFKSMDPPPM
ncbi:unnamed protein product [Pedinophyceae sp. YPF-701]|nr:unnamed protein product [Pedinophyceae sp. YPF-701]